ncbi:glutathione S-transferase family protein [uncultured Ramlibacter sp.]|uniref:glutathione S-transferase family protein n=1 Tax=uncultured Ramlibacter sp. TaxID=260755 RepID=UPI002631595E|nr:glutathione S-transferase family protein [uncultured Ramlibacter sp.]
MALALYHHPLSSHCHKVLIALYELALPFEPHLLNLGDPQQRSDFLALWPTGKIPLLLDGDLLVPETSIQVEYLAQHHAPSGQTLLPADAQAALEVRLMDRLVDLYVMHPMQAIVADRLRGEGKGDPIAVAKAKETLAMAYGLLEKRIGERTWLAGDAFSLADCTAAPSLFYATTLVPLAPAHQRLAAYFERLLARPSVARVLDEARPFFQYYPYREALPARFYKPE